MDDLYVVVMLRADTEEIRMDEHELMGARWMSSDEVEARVPAEPSGALDGKVSATNWTFVEQALAGRLISGKALPPARAGLAPSMLYVHT